MVSTGWSAESEESRQPRLGALSLYVHGLLHRPKKAFHHEPIDEGEKISFEAIDRRVELLLQHLDDLNKRLLLHDELPDACADIVEAKVRTCREIEHHGLAIQIANDDVGCRGEY
jgi:hypothetical protein